MQPRLTRCGSILNLFNVVEEVSVRDSDSPIINKYPPDIPMPSATVTFSCARAKPAKHPTSARCAKVSVHSLIGVDSLVPTHHGPKLPRGTHRYPRPRSATWIKVSFMHCITNFEASKFSGSRFKLDMNPGPTNTIISFVSPSKFSRL